jgi:beta-xylosidase
VVKTYVNPVYDQYMADPFVLRNDHRYYAYGTTRTIHDGKQFRILESNDLATWKLRGGALVPTGDLEFWAPEVTYHDQMYYMYYSAGSNVQNHQLRVATSRTPLGPFEDTGHVLTPNEPFAIDAHPFRDASGDWYLFYSRDFLTLDGEYHVGTGIVVDRMLDMVTLAGRPHLVVRPFADWQLFEAHRPMYGGIYDWYTVEGAATRVHDGRYYCFYSGGAWLRENYGVGYVVADHPLGPYRRPADDSPILRSLPGQVIGPGHNSFTEAPNGREYIIYHGWDPAMTARLMRIDRLEWDGARPVVRGPTTTLQPLEFDTENDIKYPGSR